MIITGESWFSVIKTLFFHSVITIGYSFKIFLVLWVDRCTGLPEEWLITHIAHHLTVLISIVWSPNIQQVSVNVNKELFFFHMEELNDTTLFMHTFISEAISPDSSVTKKKKFSL